MDPLHLAIALSPLAVYLLILGVVNLSQRPMVASGTRDAAALAVAIAGFVIAGPMELFMPQAAANKFGGYVWILLLGLYFITASLIVMLLRPRIVVYNATLEDVRVRLEAIAVELDKDARWAGDSLSLPNVGVELSLEEFVPMRNVQLVATGSEQNLNAWRHIESMLAERLRNAQVPLNPHGFSFLMVGGMMIAVVAVQMFSNQPAVAQALKQMLQL